MKRPRCEFRQFYPDQCRARAVEAISHLVPFGELVSMTGPATQVMLEKVTLRCGDHGEVKNRQGALPIADYLARLQETNSD